MKTHHTEGPWHIGKRYPAGAIYDEKGAEVCAFSDLLHPAEVAANARLIAAAPELLELCQAMFLWLQAEEKKGYPKDSVAAYFVPSILKSARAALAKAEGTS